MMDFVSDNAGMIGLLFFFSTFCGVVFWAFRPSKKQDIENHRFIPLEGDDA